MVFKKINKLNIVEADVSGNIFAQNNPKNKYLTSIDKMKSGSFEESHKIIKAIKNI